jgi:hypothetical protein
VVVGGALEVLRTKRHLGRLGRSAASLCVV